MVRRVSKIIARSSSRAGHREENLHKSAKGSDLGA